MLSVETTPVGAAVIVLLCVPAVHAADFNRYGTAPTEFVAPQMDRPDLVFEIGLSGDAAPAYMGSGELGMGFSPIIRVERINIPGIIDIGGTKSRGGFKFAPSIAVQSERKAENHPELAGLYDLEMTFEVGGRIGYEIPVSDTLSAQLYGAVRYAFGGAEGFTGDVGLDVTAQLTPQLEIIGGVSAALADENYTDDYFGVSSSEAAASGGALDQFDPAAGVTSVGAKVAARYEFIPDTFFNAKAEYRRLVGSVADSPIVKAGNENQFVFGVGLSRRFSFVY